MPNLKNCKEHHHKYDDNFFASFALNPMPNIPLTA